MLWGSCPGWEQVDRLRTEGTAAKYRDVLDEWTMSQTAKSVMEF